MLDKLCIKKLDLPRMVQMKFKLFFLLAFFVLVSTGCHYQPYIKVEHNQIIINENSKVTKIDIQNKLVNKFQSCTNHSFTVDNIDLHIEYIELSQGCNWTALGESYYMNFLHDEFKRSKVVKTINEGRVTIYKYQSNDKYFYFISLYGTTSTTFIVDYTGDLSTKLANIDLHLQDYEKLIENEKLSKSLLDNFFKGYFYRDSSSSIDFKLH